jgi:hypothetical protein
MCKSICWSGLRIWDCTPCTPSRTDANTETFGEVRACYSGCVLYCTLNPSCPVFFVRHRLWYYLLVSSCVVSFLSMQRYAFTLRPLNSATNATLRHVLGGSRSTGDRASVHGHMAYCSKRACNLRCNTRHRCFQSKQPIPYSHANLPSSPRLVLSSSA